MDLKQLIKEAHETAVSKGWWETENPFENQIANMHAELSEAWEDYRNNRGLNEIYWECKGGYDGGKTCPFKTCYQCNHNKPCGIPVELADVCIRIFDTLGEFNDVDEVERNYRSTSLIEPQTLALLIIESHDLLNNAYNLIDNKVEFLVWTIQVIEKYCLDNKIDLEKAIEMKMRFNKLRSYRHGGKKA